MTQRVKFTGLIVGVFSLSFLLFGIGTPRILGSVQESDRARNSSGFGFRANRGTVAVVAVGMWKPAFGAGFQAPWDGQQIFGKDCAIDPTERHFHREPAILPILVQISPLGAAQCQNPCFQEAA
jgi:hypothetical protein